MSAESVAGLYDELAQERAREALAAFGETCQEPAYAERALAQMASTLEDAAAVLTFVARESESLADVSEALSRQAAALVALAGRLEQAAELGRG